MTLPAKDVQELVRLAKGKDLSSVTAGTIVPEPHLDDDAYQLSFRTERMLSEDFAFLAANEDGPTRVSAASFVASRYTTNSLLSVACNQGVQQDVRSAISEIVSELQSIAGPSSATELDVTQCAEQLLNIILQCHQNRILGRVGSPHYQVPPGCKGGKPALIGKDLSNIKVLVLRRHRPWNAETTKMYGEVTAFLYHVNELAQGTGKPDKLSTYKEIVKTAFALTVDGVSLGHRLRTFGLPALPTASRDTRQVSALANYWRICLYLARAARTYRKVFRSLRLEFMEWGSQEEVVHAEVQLLVHHETSDAALRPRIISASKKPCFLCHIFINAYGWYVGPDTHGEIYPNWHLPAGVDFTTHAGRRIQDALNYTASVVSGTIKEYQVKIDTAGGWPPAQAQSVINLNLVVVPSAAPSSIDDTHVVTMNNAISEDLEEQASGSSDKEREQGLMRADSGLVVPPLIGSDPDTPELTEGSTTSPLSIQMEFLPARFKSRPQHPAAGI